MLFKIGNKVYVYFIFKKVRIAYENTQFHPVFNHHIYVFVMEMMVFRREVRIYFDEDNQYRNIKRS